MKDHSKLIGILLLCAALGLMAWQSQDQAKRMKAYQEANPDAYATPTTTATSEAKPATTSTTTASVIEPTVVKSLELGEESFTSLENDLVKMVFTSRGGALHSVSFKSYPETMRSKEPYLWTAPETSPALSLANESGETLDLANYELVESSADSLTYRRDLGNGLSLERRYTLTTPEKRRTANGYLLKLENIWRNSSADALKLPDYGLFIATAAPSPSDPSNLHLNFGTYNGSDGKYVTPTVFNGGNFILWQTQPKARYDVAGTTAWATVKNQFFTTISTPSVPAIGAWATPVEIPDGEKTLHSLAGGIKMPSVTIPASGSVSVAFDNYIGPMEYGRIASLDSKQDDVMQWGWPIFSFFAKLFISLLNTIAKAVQNYGVAIVILTLIIRAAMWPFTDASGKASKKMTAIQPLMKEIQTKYKDNPEKQQKETLKVFQQYKINPLAGCLPSLLQIPVFLGFFYMLRSAAELRFEQFLWIKDLSMPDTIATVAGFPINPLPIIMLITMYFQIKLTPTSGDPSQQKIMLMTPFIFAFMLYGFSSGLTLYWTLSNLVSIIQQIRINRHKDKLDTPDSDKSDGKVIDISVARA
jgi:YidC/Oxa1 family membrane protein insertase